MNSNLECIELNWKILGAKLAMLSNVEQTAFFKGFAQEMNKYETVHQRDIQLVYIVNGQSENDEKLTDDEKEVYEFLGAKTDD